MYAAFAVGTLPIAFTRAAWSLLALAITGAYLGVLILLVWLAARRRQNWARWLLFALFVLVTATELWSARLYLRYPLEASLQVAITLLEAAAYWFAFTGASKDWFAGRDPIDPNIF